LSVALSLTMNLKVAGSLLFYLVLLKLNIISRADKICEAALRLELKEDEVKSHEQNDSISHDNFHYPKGTFGKHGSEYYGCPCQVKHCLRLCKEGIQLFDSTTK